jgi:dihydroxyacid dehydratase/phosphogluconate dehydratase
MLHLRQLGLLDTSALTVTGDTLATMLDAWESSPRRDASLKHLRKTLGVEPTQVILNPAAAKAAGLTSTVVFPQGNLAPEGSVIKATAISPEVVGADGIYRHRGPARVFTSEHQAIAALKGASSPLEPGNVLVLMGVGPLGTGMEETYQLTSALKHLPWGKTIPIITDARFSGVSTGACIGHVGPEALAGGPIGRVQDGDIVEIEVDRNALTGTLNLVGTSERQLSPSQAQALLDERPAHPALQPHPELPSDTRLWAALQQASGGTWAGCVYDVDRIIALLEAGKRSELAKD